MRHHRPADQKLAAVTPEPRLNEYGAAAILAEMHRAERQCRAVGRRLRTQEETGEIAERIEIEHGAPWIFERRRAVRELRRRPHAAHAPQLALLILQHAVLGQLGENGARQRGHRRARREELLHEHAVIEGMMLHERGTADEPRRKPEPQPDRARARIGIEDHVAAVERQRQYGHRPLRQDLVLVPEERNQRLPGPGREGNERRTRLQARCDNVVGVTARTHGGVERGDAVGQVAAEAEHEADRKPRGGDVAQAFGRQVVGKLRDADQRLRLDRVAHARDLHGAPQHGHRGDGQPGTPSPEQRQRSLDEIGKLHDDAIAWIEAELDEKSGQRIHRLVGVGVREGAGPGEPEQVPVRRIDQRHGVRLLPRPPPQQPFGRDRSAFLVRLDVRGGQCAHACKITGSRRARRCRPGRKGRATRCRSDSRRAASSRAA